MPSGVYIRTEEIKKKMSDSLKKHFSEKKHPWFGRHHTDESKEKMSKTKSVNYLGKQNPFYGKHHTEASKQKISKAKIGKSIKSKGKKKAPFSDDHRKHLSEARKGKKFSEEHKKNLSKAQTGEKHPMFGKHHSEESKKKLSDALKGKYVGEKSSNWQGGINPLTKQIRSCLKYRQWRDDIYTRDDFICLKCGVRGGKLQAHHIKPFSKIIEDNKITTFEQAIDCEELWSLNNGQTLCKNCHQSLKKNL